ncbi:MAG TPA: hypothetical protein DCG28_02985 [Lachnospiraceae bacterium]|nr:hypothetical protein [Lachnospiraceae bacterium]
MKLDMEMLKTNKYKIAGASAAIIVVCSFVAILTHKPIVKEDLEKETILTKAQYEKKKAAPSTTFSTSTTNTTTVATTVTDTASTTETTTELPPLPQHEHIIEAVEHEPTEFATDTFVYNGYTFKPGENIDDVISLLGMPLNAVQAEPSTSSSDGGTESFDDFSDSFYIDGNVYLYDGFTVERNNGNTLSRVSVTDSSIPTPGGIYPIGSYIFEVTSRFGPPTQLDDDNSIYYYDVSKDTQMYFICPNAITSEWGVMLK